MFKDNMMERQRARGELARVRRLTTMGEFVASIASHAMAGRTESAREAYIAYQRLDPNGRISNLRDHIAFKREEDVEKFACGLRIAGMPD
jgi:hypothetical protein